MERRASKGKKGREGKEGGGGEGPIKGQPMDESVD